MTSVVQSIQCPQNPPWKLWSEFLFSLNMNNIPLCVCKHVGRQKHTQKHMRMHTQAQKRTHRSLVHIFKHAYTQTHTHTPTTTTSFRFLSVYLLIGTHEGFHATTTQYVLLHIIAHTSLHLCQQWTRLHVLIHSCYLLVFLVVAIVMGMRSLDIAWIAFA